MLDKRITKQIGAF